MPTMPTMPPGIYERMAQLFAPAVINGWRRQLLAVAKLPETVSDDGREVQVKAMLAEHALVLAAELAELVDAPQRPPRFVYELAVSAMAEQLAGTPGRDAQRFGDLAAQDPR